MEGCIYIKGGLNIYNTSVFSKFINVEYLLKSNNFEKYCLSSIKYKGENYKSNYFEKMTTVTQRR